ncbi:hypothetical protein [Shimwellia blattae]|uniref:Packaged DNA stabilization protein n=1 Tax=Shimwellia blattae (strain ATCC 29907 / DSM 4481 / JCM 1650 / NBRC 105725 / CDC 9005-74) TaxID=630626 RepID=I2B9Q8_SHIBC|nr:hypothetical protein [Shimwellia blattae]AFJ47262.1 packaged DNA stabilization protein [Shimwellia blattae DSM 4481 = NBRC 105725]GAB82209.1 hypothetical protein EB105725_21_00070 [Shimwellia blattae DSM 4481 = NBRC 105725]VDY64755.1 Uncharacterised protein [Shimwellia blattae]VEC22854.1 Uncharacterised protein [Shimwellia blattae]
MADNSLNEPVVLQAVGVMASSLPTAFSPAYRQYVLEQTSDATKVAQKANDAGGGAYDAQVRNDEQDIELADHASRLTAAEAELGNHETRITNAEENISALDGRVKSVESDVSALQTDVSALQSDVAAIQGDYVSTSDTAEQSLSGALDVAGYLSVDGTKVVGPQQTGWTAGAGTPNLAAFNADQTFAVSNPPTQAEVKAIADALTASCQRILALEQMARIHGLIA